MNRPTPPDPLDETSLASPLHYKPGETALLVLDLHDLLFHIGPQFEVAGKVAARLSEWARTTGIPVVHGLTDPDGNYPAQAKNKANWDNIANTFKDKPEMLEHESVRPSQKALDEGTEIIFRRRVGVSALDSSMQAWLQQNGIKSLILTGISTGGCIINTAKSAADQLYVVTVIEDATAERDDARQKAALSMLENQCHIVSSEQLMSHYK